MKKISLTQNKIAFVDNEDFDHLNSFNWCYKFNKGQTGYAKRKLSIKEQKIYGKKFITMHRFIMGDPKGLEIDHINRNKLDIIKTGGTNDSCKRFFNGTQSPMSALWHHLLSSRRDRRRRQA